MPFSHITLVAGVAYRHHHLSTLETEIAMKQAEMRMKLMQLSSGAAIAATRRSKCPGCGSHEFRKHHLRTVCSYCRVEV